jgi:hypothetical protein
LALGRVEGPWAEAAAWALMGLAFVVLVTTAVLHVRTIRRLRQRSGGSA